MAIDSTLFGVNLPAGAYSVGQVLDLGVISGPANVRSGRGKATLKRIFSGALVSNSTYWRIHVKNSDWIDDASNLAGYLNQATCLDVHSGMTQFGNDCDLTPNSGWQVYAECIAGGTSTVDTSLFCLIDIDYPQVSAIQDPDRLIGVPTSITLDMPSVPVFANGAIESLSWKTENVDYFKAGYEYCLQEISATAGAGSFVGFVALSNAAGMGGLRRIIPINNIDAGIRSTIQYASKLVKGPMDISVALFAVSAGSASLYMVHDYVKRSV